MLALLSPTYWSHSNTIWTSFDSMQVSHWAPHQDKHSWLKTNIDTARYIRLSLAIWCSSTCWFLCLSPHYWQLALSSRQSPRYCLCNHQVVPVYACPMCSPLGCCQSPLRYLCRTRAYGIHLHHHPWMSLPAFSDARKVNLTTTPLWVSMWSFLDQIQYHGAPRSNMSSTETKYQTIATAIAKLQWDTFTHWIGHQTTFIAGSIHR